VKLPNAVPKPKTRKRAPKGLKRSRMKSRGPRSKKSGRNLFPKSVRPEYRDYIRGQPCILTGRFWWKSGYAWQICHGHTCVGRIQSCHVTSRGAGGADFANLYPGCAAAHHEQHAIGIKAFSARWGVDLKKIAEQLYHDFLQSGGSGDPNP